MRQIRVQAKGASLRNLARESRAVAAALAAKSALVKAGECAKRKEEKASKRRSLVVPTMTIIRCNADREPRKAQSKLLQALKLRRLR